MMNAKDAIMQIRALFEDMPQVEAPAPAPEVPVTFAEYSLIDGTKVMISELVVGGEVTLADGTLAPMGEHQLADGTSIQVDELGKIIEIASPKEDVMPEDMPMETPAVMGKKLDQQMADEIAALVSENQSLKTQVAQLETKVKNGFSQVAELIEALTKTPNAEPIAQPKQNFGSNVTTHDMKYDRIAKFRNALLNK